jgi:hypothetical protein
MTEGTWAPAPGHIALNSSSRTGAIADPFRPVRPPVARVSCRAHRPTSVSTGQPGLMFRIACSGPFALGATEIRPGRGDRVRPPTCPPNDARRIGGSRGCRPTPTPIDGENRFIAAPRKPRLLVAIFSYARWANQVKNLRMAGRNLVLTPSSSAWPIPALGFPWDDVQERLRMQSRAPTR